MQHNPEELFQLALQMADDETIVIPCRDYKEMEVIRTRLYKELRKLRDISRELASEVTITRTTKNNSCVIVLAKRPLRINDAFLVRGDGSVEVIIPGKKRDEEMRIRELMAEDGMSPEEIDEELRKEKEKVDESKAEES